MWLLWRAVSQTTCFVIKNSSHAFSIDLWKFWNILVSRRHQNNDFLIIERARCISRGMWRLSFIWSLTISQCLWVSTFEICVRSFILDWKVTCDVKHVNLHKMNIVKSRECFGNFRIRTLRAKMCVFRGSLSKLKITIYPRMWVAAREKFSMKSTPRFCPWYSKTRPRIPQVHTCTMYIIWWCLKAAFVDTNRN